MSKRPFLSQYESPNIVIVPTVSFGIDPPDKKQKLEHVSPVLHQDSQQTWKQTLDQSPSFVKETQNVMNQNQMPMEDLNKNCHSVDDLNTAPKKLNSWASNYLMSVGECNKHTKLNLSLSRKNERMPKEGVSVNNKKHLNNHVSNLETYRGRILNPEEFNKKSNDKLLNIDRYNRPTSMKNEDLKILSKTNQNLEIIPAYEIERYRTQVALNDCNEELMDTNIVPPKSTNKIDFNHKAPKMFNLISSYVCDKVDNTINRNNICTEIRSQDSGLFSNTNHINENDTNIFMTNISNSLKPLPKLIQSSETHKSTYKREYGSINTTKNDYLHNKSWPNEIKGATTKNSKYKSNSDVDNRKKRDTSQSKTPSNNSSSDFENISNSYKNKLKSAKCASKKSSFYEFNGKSSKTINSSIKKPKHSAEISRNPGKKYLRKTTNESSTILSGHCHKSEVERKLSKSDSKSGIGKSYFDAKEKTGHKNKTSKNLLKPAPNCKNKKEIVTEQIKSKTKLKSVVKSPSRISRSCNNKDKIFQDLCESQKSISHISKLQVKENLKSKSPSNTPDFFKDLRAKLSGKRVSLNHYFSKLRNCDKNNEETIPKNRENLIITVENDVDDDMKSEDKTLDEVTTQSQKVLQFKQIKLVIKVIHEKLVSTTSDTNIEDEGNVKENDDCALNNIDLSFLDDFNVDEIVESLNECQNESETNEITEELVRINNNNLDENSMRRLKSPISIEDGERIRGAPDIHDEETMELPEMKENENITESIIHFNTATDDQRSCIQEFIQTIPTVSSYQNSTILLDDSVKVEMCKNLKMKSSNTEPQEESNVIVLEDSSDNDVISVKNQSIVAIDTLTDVHTKNLQDSTLLTLCSKENRVTGKESNMALLQNVKIEPNAMENVLVTIPKDEKMADSSLIYNLKIEPRTEDNVVVTISEDKKEDNASVTDNIKIEPSTKDNVLIVLSESEEEDNTQLIANIKMESSLKDNTLIVKKDTFKQKPTKDMSSVEKLNTDLMETETDHAKDVDTSIKLEPTETYIKQIQNIPLGDIQILDKSNEISIHVNKTIQSINNKGRENNSQEKSEDPLNNNKPNTTVTVTTLSSDLDLTDLSVRALSDKVTIQNSTATKYVEEMCMAKSEDEESVTLSLDLNVNELSNESSKDNNAITNTSKVKTTTTGPDSTSILSSLVHSKPDVKDIEIKRMPHIISLKGANKFLVENIEARMLQYLYDKYTVTSYIHTGQFSKIFQCKNSSGQDYTVKVVKKKNANHNLNLLKEKMLMCLQKDIPQENFSCVYLFNGFGIKGHWCFLSEYYPKNLTQALRGNKKPFHIDVVQELSRQLVVAVTILRNNNVVHSDIKPSHILLNSSNNRLKLCGFDEAYYVGCVDVLPNIGTVNYRAPELILGYSADFSIDVWSVALVMFEMATTRKLFPGNYNNDILFKQMCTLGNIPYDMIHNSLFRDNHFEGMVFKRRMGYKGQTTVFCESIKKNFILTKSIFKAHNIWYSKTAIDAKKRDHNKLTVFRNLLEKMLALHPKQRMPIQFVYANPFIATGVDC